MMDLGTPAHSYCNLPPARLPPQHLLCTVNRPAPLTLAIFALPEPLPTPAPRLTSFPALGSSEPSFPAPRI